MSRIFAAVNAGLNLKLPTGMNGRNIPVDMSASQQFVTASQKVVLNDQGTINLNDSLVYLMSTVRVNSTSMAPVTEAEYTVLSAAIGDLLVKFNFCDLLHVAGYYPVVRLCDTVSPAEVTALPNHAMYKDCAEKLWHYINTHPESYAQLTSTANMFPYAAVASAIHRQKVGGHNWITDNTTVAGEVANSTLSIAGALSGQLSEYMIRIGHDVTHLFSDTSLHEIAMFLTGNTRLKMNGIFKYAGTEYDGSAREVFLDELINLNEAARCRYPISTIGVSGLILVLQRLPTFILAVSQKYSRIQPPVTTVIARGATADDISHARSVDKQNTSTYESILRAEAGLLGDVEKVCANIITIVTLNKDDRVVIDNIKTMIAPAAGALWGFYEANKTMRAVMEKNKSLVTFCNSSDAIQHVAVGAAAAEHLKNVAPNAIKSGVTIERMMSSILSSINTLSVSGGGESIDTNMFITDDDLIDYEVSA